MVFQYLALAILTLFIILGNLSRNIDKSTDQAIYVYIYIYYYDVFTFTYITAEHCIGGQNVSIFLLR